MAQPVPVIFSEALNVSGPSRDIVACACLPFHSAAMAYRLCVLRCVRSCYAPLPPR